MFIHPPSSRDSVQLLKSPVSQPARKAALSRGAEPHFSGSGEDLFRWQEFQFPNEPVAVKSYLLNEHPKTVIRTVAPKTENPEVIRVLGKALLDNGKSIDESVFMGNNATLLHWAVGRGKPEFVQVLLEMGANPAVRDKRGQTALGWLERMKEGTPRKDRQAIEALLQERLVEMAQPKPVDSSAKPSSWTSWLFGGHSADSGSKPDAGKSVDLQSEKQEKKIYADSEAQTEEYVSPREQELSGKLEGVSQSLKSLQRQHAESERKLPSLTEQLAEAQEKNKTLQRQLVPLQRGNSTLQSGNENLRHQLQEMSEKLENATHGKGQAEQRLSEVEASGAKSERELRKQIQTLQQKLEKKQQVELKLAELEKDKARVEKDGQQNRKNDQQQIKQLQSENKLLRGNLDKSEKSLQTTRESEQKARNESTGKTTQLEKLQQENAELRREFESQVSDLKDKLSTAEMAREAAHNQSVGHQEETGRLNQLLKERQNEANLMMARQESREGHFNRRISGLQAENQQLSTRMQAQKQEMMQRLQVEEHKSLTLREQLVTEREKRLTLEKQHDSLQRETAEMQARFQDERHFLNGRLGLAEQARENFASQCGALEHSRNSWEQAFWQHDAALAHANRKHGMFGEVVHDLMGQVSATQQQGQEDRKLASAMQDALFQSNDLDEIRRKVIRLISEQEQRMQAVTPKDPSAMIQALNIDQPLPPEFED